MEKGRLYPQIGQRWIDAHNVNNWPPRRCSLVVDVEFDGILRSLRTPDVLFSIEFGSRGVAYHVLMDDGHGRDWAIDWGMFVNDYPFVGITRFASVIDQPSGESVKQESIPRESSHGFPWWTGVFQWLPMPLVTKVGTRFSDFIVVTAPADQYF